MHPLLHPLFINFIEHFNGDRDYFECHEVLEEYWKEIDPGNKDHPLTAWIQLATGMYHWRRDNFNGAYRMLTKASWKISSHKDSPFFAGIDHVNLLADIKRAITAIEKSESFVPFRLKLSMDLFGGLLNEQELVELFKLPEPESLIHKHMRRDRRHILEERQTNLEQRKRDRSH